MEYLVIVVVCLAVYFRSLNYQPVVDDVSNRVKHNQPEAEDQHSLIVKVRRALDGNYPVRSIQLDRAITIVIHIIVCCLMCAAFGTLVPSLLFAVNISNNQVTLWLNGKRYGINTIVCLLAYISPWFIPLWFITPYFQASAISFPLLLAFKYNFWLLSAIPLGLLLGRKFLINWGKSRIKSNNFPFFTDWNNGKICLIAKTFTFYLIRGLIPFIPSMYINYLRNYGLLNEDTDRAFKFDLAAAFGFLLIVTIPILFVVNPTFFLGLMWWLVTIAVFSNYITVTMIFAERYMYLPNVGLMLFLTNLLSLIDPQLWLLVFGLYVGRLISYMPMYRDLDTFFEHHLYTDPTNDTGWVGAINIAVAKKDSATGLQLTNRALNAGAMSPRIWINRAALIAAYGDKKMAFECLDEADLRCTDGYRDIMLPKINQLRKEISEKETKEK